MTLRDDLTTLLADAGIDDVDVDEAVADEHVRWSAYRRIVAATAASEHRDSDRRIVATILRDPEEMVSRSAFVELVDSIALRMTEPAEFEQWAAELGPEIDLLKAEGNREFLHRRMNDWKTYLAIRSGHTPTSAELAAVTDWMQRLLAEESTSRPVLTLLAETGRTKKTRNIAKNRASSRAITDSAS
jgi:hypothetical protein